MSDCQEWNCNVLYAASSVHKLLNDHKNEIPTYKLQKLTELDQEYCEKLLQLFPTELDNSPVEKIHIKWLNP